MTLHMWHIYIYQLSICQNILLNRTLFFVQENIFYSKHSVSANACDIQISAEERIALVVSDSLYESCIFFTLSHHEFRSQETFCLLHSILVLPCCHWVQWMIYDWIKQHRAWKEIRSDFGKSRVSGILLWDLT